MGVTYGRLDCQIMPLGGEHRMAWERLYRGYAEFYGVPMDEEILATTWSWLMDPNHVMEGVAGVAGGDRLLGFAHFRPFPDPLAGREACFLDDLFVDPDSRGGGVARALLLAVRDEARERGWSRVQWLTARDNLRGRALYDQYASSTSWITYEMEP